MLASSTCLAASISGSTRLLLLEKMAGERAEVVEEGSKMMTRKTHNKNLFMRAAIMEVGQSRQCFGVCLAIDQ